MTATQADSEDYQHWHDDDELLQQPPVAARGYDSHNSLRAHFYSAPSIKTASSTKTASPEAPKAQAYAQPQVIYSYPQPQQMAYYPMQYTYAPQPQVIGYPAPAYYGYGYPQPAAPQPMPASHVYQPAYSAPQPKEWKGRTKAEVEEDNMKIAAKEGAYDKRKVVPVGMKDDQMMWCVEVDGSHTLR